MRDSGESLWYAYDFGDGWDHRLSVEAVLGVPPAGVVCTAGRLACPPEDSGGVGGYAGLAVWVRGGCEPSSLPEPFDDVEQARDWLPLDWHPDRFDLDEVNVALAGELAAPVAVHELAALRDRLEFRGTRALTVLLARTASLEPPVMEESDAALLLEPLTVLLDVIGDGVRLTSAGYLPPAVVVQVAERTGVTQWWIGKANREDLTWPILRLRTVARALGLVSVRRGLLAQTAVARRYRDRPLDLWRHVVSRLPLGSSDFDRQSGWMTLAVVSSGASHAQWDWEVGALMTALGWRPRSGPAGLVYADPVDPTRDLLEVLGRTSRRTEDPALDAAVTATARAVLLRDDSAKG